MKLNVESKLRIKPNEYINIYENIMILKKKIENIPINAYENNSFVMIFLFSKIWEIGVYLNGFIKVN